MTPPGSARLPALDEPWKRLPLVMLVSLVVWGALLLAFGFLLELTPRPSSDLETLDARIIELPATGLTGGGGGSPSAGESSSGPKAAKAPPIAKSKPKKSLAVRPPPVEPEVKDARPTYETEKTEPIPYVPDAEIPKASSQPEAAANPTSNQPGGLGAADEGGIGNGTGSGVGNGVGDGSATGAGGGFGTGGSGPEAIYAPAPAIPDDMRDEVLEAVAVARFQVSHDGKAMVSLTKPTDFSRLNDIILETLRQWRFRPALRNGVAVDSSAEVRLLITVQ